MRAIPHVVVIGSPLELVLREISNSQELVGEGDAVALGLLNIGSQITLRKVSYGSQQRGHFGESSKIIILRCLFNWICSVL